MGEALIRFIIGGLLVTAFAVLGDMLKPKSFAGLFGAAPSVALATLILTIHSEGRVFASAEAPFDDLWRSRLFRLCLHRLPRNHALQAAGVRRRERIDRSGLALAFGLEIGISR
jgi:Protein of unknown function (DUF3147)